MRKHGDDVTGTQRILVTGAGGQLGQYLRVSLTNAGHAVIGMGRQPGPGVDVIADIRDESQIVKALYRTSPDAIIHGAAYTDVDGCERDPRLADSVNHIGSANLAALAQSLGIWMIGVGTDFVFSGNDGAPYHEDRAPNPISVYGSTKLAGEQAILDADRSFAVARTAWLYGGQGKHFPRTVLGMLERHGKMEVVDDEIGSPTFAGDLANALVALLPNRPSGVLHLTNEGATSRFGLAQRVASAAGKDPYLITPVSTAAFLAKYPLPASRPANSTLINTRAAALGVKLPRWEDAVDRYVPSLVEELAEP